MQSEPREYRSDLRVPPPLGIVRQPTQHDPRLDPKILAAVGRIAPGTDLRSAIDDIIRSRDGALIVNESVSKLAHANVQLMPDPTIPSVETGTRHRTAERVAKQTEALVTVSYTHLRAHETPEH